MGPICKRLHCFYREVVKLTTDSLYTFTQEIRRMGRRIMSTLEEMTYEAKMKMQQVRSEKRMKSANKSMKSSGGLNFWHEQAELRKDLFPKYKAKNTGMLRGMMTNLVIELEEQEGLDTPRKIQDRFEEIIDGWEDIAGMAFTSLKTGGARRVPNTPVFEYYYAYRTELDAILGRRDEQARHLKKIETLDDAEYWEGTTL